MWPHAWCLPVKYTTRSCLMAPTSTGGAYSSHTPAPMSLTGNGATAKNSPPGQHYLPESHHRTTPSSTVTGPYTEQSKTAGHTPESNAATSTSATPHTDTSPGHQNCQQTKNSSPYTKPYPRSKTPTKPLPGQQDSFTGKPPGTRSLNNAPTPQKTRHDQPTQARTRNGGTPTSTPDVHTNS